MARVVSIPATLWPKSTTFDNESAVLDGLQRAGASATPESPVGAILRFHVADGFAVYRVAKTKPLTLQWVPWCDHYRLAPAYERGLALRDVAALVRYDRAMDVLFERQRGTS